MSETQPSARALEYAHDGRWPDDRIDLARLCEGFANEIVRLRATLGADVLDLARDCLWRHLCAVVAAPIYDGVLADVASAIQQYGDERAREARAAPHVNAEEHVVRNLRKAAAEWRAAGNESVLSIFNAVAICHMVDAVNEAACEAREAALEEAASVMPLYQFSGNPDLQAICASACVTMRYHIRALAEPQR